MYRTNSDDYLPESKVKIIYHLDHPHPKVDSRNSNSFRYYDLPPMGLGPEGKLFIPLDEHIDLSDIDGVRCEIEDNMQYAAENLVYMTPFGLIPQHINDEKCLDSYLLNAEKYGIREDAYSYASKIDNYHALKRYYISKFNITKSWKRVFHFRRPLPFYEKGNPTDWKNNIDRFPKLRRLIESLPFKHMGIALIFRSKEDNRLLIHRDSYARNHCLQHINISLSKQNRRVFVYDPISNTRTYLDSDTRSYTFNECDLHGADPQFDHMVLRIDGQFEDWFCKKLGYENNVSFDWGYYRPQDYIRQVGSINIWNDTDI
jgi:hypothetical protein